MYYKNGTGVGWSYCQKTGYSTIVTGSGYSFERELRLSFDTKNREYQEYYNFLKNCHNSFSFDPSYFSTSDGGR